LAVNTWNYYTYVDGIVLKRSWAGEVRNASTARVIGRFSACEAVELEDIVAAGEKVRVLVSSMASRVPASIWTWANDGHFAAPRWTFRPVERR
jgi:hypothetical protein